MNISIRKKFLGTIAIVIVFLFCLSSFLLSRLSQANKALERMYETDYANTSLVADIDGLLTRVDINILRMIAIGDPASIRTWKQENAERFSKADAALSKLAASSEGAQLATVKNLDEAYRKMQAGMTHQVQLIEKGDVPGGAEVNRLEVKDNANRVFTTLAEMKKALEASASARFQQQQQAADAAYLVSLIAVLSATVISVGLGLLVVGSVIRKLGGEPDYAAAIAQHISDGDLSIHIRVKDDDRGSLLFAMRAMRDNLARLIGDVQGSTNSIASASQQIASGNAHLSSRTEEQAASLEETASSIEELTSTVKQNADNARQANQLAVTASDVATKGGAVVSEVVQTMGAINDSARKIVDIIAVIDGIAFQTNILALNAAVEAARAGEQGRGFAVVASEVRNLAQRSAGAAKEIKMLIDDSVEKVGAGTKLVGQAGVTMDEVVDSVRRVTDIMSEIANASQEQSAGIAQVNQSIIEMDSMTQQNAALVEEAAAAAQSLQDQAAELARVVSIFKLVDGEERVVAPAPVAKPAVVKPIATAARTPVKKLAAKPAPAPAAKPKKVAAEASTAGSDEWEEF